MSPSHDAVPVPQRVYVGIDAHGRPVSTGATPGAAEHPDAKLYAIYQLATTPIQDPAHPGYGRSGLGPFGF